MNTNLEKIGLYKNNSLQNPTIPGFDFSDIKNHIDDAIKNQTSISIKNSENKNIEIHPVDNQSALLLQGKKNIAEIMIDLFHNNSQKNNINFSFFENIFNELVNHTQITGINLTGLTNVDIGTKSNHKTEFSSPNNNITVHSESKLCNTEKKGIEIMLKNLDSAKKYFDFNKELQNKEEEIRQKFDEKTRELKKANEEMRNQIRQRKKSEDLTNIYNLQLMSLQEKLKKKITRIDSKRVPLTSKEKLTLYGILQYPEYNSKQLSKKIDVLPNTIVSIIKRLKDEEYLKKAYIPRFEHLGLKSLSYRHISFEPNTEGINHKLHYLNEDIKNMPEIIHYFISKSDALLISISKDWGTNRTIQESITSIIKKNGLTGSSKTGEFSLDSINLTNYFDYSGIIKNKFDFEFETEPKDYDFKKIRTLNPREKILLFTMIHNPEMTVHELAKETKISAPTICKLRKNMSDDKVFETSFLPDIIKTGTEHVFLSHHTMFSPNNQTAHRTMQEYSYLALNSEKEVFEVGLYENYKDIQNHIKECPICSKNIPSEAPHNLIIPLDSVLYSKLEFNPLTSKILE